MKLIKTGILQFLDLIRLKGDIETNEVVFNITKTGIGVQTKTANNVVAISGNYKGEFEQIGEIGIADLGQLRKFVSSFDSQELELSKTKNKLILKATEENVEIQNTITNPEYIKIKVPEDKLKSHIKSAKGNEFTLTQEIIKKITSLSSVIKAQDVLLVGDKNTLSLQLAEQENKILASFDIEEAMEPFKIKFQASYINNLLSQVKQDIVISAKTNQPMYIQVDNDAYTIEYIVAPIEIK